MAPSKCSGAPTVPLAEEGRELLLLSNPKMIFGFPLTLHHPAVDLPFSISDTSSKDITVGTSSSWIQPPTKGGTISAPFCHLHQQQQISTRQFGKAVAHPGASRATVLPPGSQWEAPSQAGKLQLCSSLLSQPCCARLAGCLQRGRAKQGYFEC